MVARFALAFPSVLLVLRVEGVVSRLLICVEDCLKPLYAHICGYRNRNQSQFLKAVIALIPRTLTLANRVVLPASYSLLRSPVSHDNECGLRSLAEEEAAEEQYLKRSTKSHSPANTTGAISINTSAG